MALPIPAAHPRRLKHVPQGANGQAGEVEANGRLETTVIP